ncbi:MAG: carboxypeptidase-like regulatory domain-containing protein [Saprospiraceae bacterium]|nr:carboxypeptidase-like regulatory domain-containing protein [Saprospiraceae bacterium]
MITSIQNLIILVSMFWITNGNLPGQSDTNISGKVTDAKTGESILFGSVNLYQNGTLIQGTETDLDGNYFISNVTPGSYDMEASYVGYTSQKLTGIVIEAGKTNRVNFSLSDDDLMNMEIVVKAYKIPLIEFDNTSQGSTVTAEKIRSLPTKNINNIVATAAGISSRNGDDISVRAVEDKKQFTF